MTPQQDDLAGHPNFVLGRIGGAEIAATVEKCGEWLGHGNPLQTTIGRCGGPTEISHLDLDDFPLCPGLWPKRETAYAWIAPSTDPGLGVSVAGEPAERDRFEGP